MILMDIVGIKIFEEKDTELRKTLESGTRKKTEAIEYLESNGAVLGTPYTKQFHTTTKADPKQEC